MPRYRIPYSITKRPDSPYYYFKLGTWTQYRTTGVTSMEEAERIAQTAYLQSLSKAAGPTLREYAEPYFLWETCPHVRRLISEGKTITRYHVADMRMIMENHILTDPISDIRLPELKRAHILDFRDRLVGKMGFARTVQKTMGALKTVIKEAFFREEIDRDPTQGIGNTRYVPAETGIFTEEELKRIFPAKIPGPWINVHAYAVFLTAAVTGMRRGEILALKWRHVNFTRSCIEVVHAWKDRHDLGKPKWEKTRVSPLPDSLIPSLSWQVISWVRYSTDL